MPLGNGSIEDERKRFADMLNGRRPTGQEGAEHEARLLQIHNERGGKTDEFLQWKVPRAAPRPTVQIAEGAPWACQWPAGKPTYAAGSLQWRR